MGILANSVSFCQFLVVGDLPGKDVFPWASGNLARHAFIPIDEGTEELSVGWVHTTNHRESSFSVPADFWHDHYLAFSIRQDRRRLPAALVKGHLQLAEQEFLATNPGLRRVPKQKREDLRERVRIQLLSRTLPVPMVQDVVWDTRSGIVTFTSLGKAAVETFDTLFRKTFLGLRLVAVHPFARAERVVDPSCAQALAEANSASSQAVLDLIRSNRWLGWDFLLWLMYRTMNETAQFRVCRPGLSADGETFTAYLDDRLVLASAGDNGVQKITVAGPQDQFSEVLTALHFGKLINEAILHLELGDEAWRLTLKGETFTFGAFKAPKVKEEKDATVDGTSEREALFFERMYLLETGLQLFDSLFAAFLGIRLGGGWQGEMRKIAAWLATE